ncbi:MAG TPA: molybdopterin-dependent oxidoreductase [Gemmatimonadaceae bacterium]|jgi:DMSO/TMAO reductase YedYZ molybdopterin-dependent catalytic subunit
MTPRQSSDDALKPLSTPALGHAAERLGIDRRRFLLAGGGAVAAAALAACNSQGPQSAKKLLTFAERKNETIERALFRHGSIDVPPTHAQIAGTHFPSYFVSPSVPMWDAAAHGEWHLEVGGMVRTPLELSLTDLAALPRTGYRLDHFCVEGWNAVALRTGVRLADLARLAGVQPGAQYVDFRSFDSNYHESWDIESAMHPQTLVVYAQDGHYLNPAWGAPARIYSPVKLGYKNTKYLTQILFLPARTGGYWSDRGYEWYGGV